MIYKPFQDLKRSALGLGCMRQPWHGETDAEIDVPKTKEMLAYAMAHGVNYYDTAWGYHYGNSETVMGELLRDYPRDSFYLATKFPGYDLSNMDKVAEIFETQLKKLQVDYFDFYLFHNVCELNIEQYLDPQYGILDYLLKQKANGRIRHLGFSVHGSNDTLRRFLDAYGKHMEFCQIQAQLYRLVVPGGGREGADPARMGHPRLGDGTAARRQTGGAAAKAHQNAARAASGRNRPGLGVPVFAKHSGCDRCAFRDVGYDAAAAKHRDV